MLAACGGSGGGGGPISTPVPPPAPTPAPPATPTPTAPQPPPQGAVPSQFDTAEFRKSGGPDFHNAEYAWQLGYTGKGVTFAVIDDGIDLDNSEFAGRVHPDSRDVLLDRSVEGGGYHGTHVALVAAAARNNSETVGMAPDATLLALRGDSPGDCNFGNPLLDVGCGVPSSALANGLDQAVASGARVVNISISNTVAADPIVLSAVKRAVDAGLVIVLSAGNLGAGSNEADPAEPLLFARSISDAGEGGVIIAGSVGPNGVHSSFSNAAGSYRSDFLSALGEGICCVYHDGSLYLNGKGLPEYLSGTSFSAPQVTGAVALLAQAFPNLTGKQIVELLLDSAFDVGEIGPDAIYGAGILDVASAFAPKGTTRLPGSSSAYALADLTAVGSPAMGDALLSQSLPAVVLDKYDRAYTVDLATRMRSARPGSILRGAVGSRPRFVRFGNQAMTAAFTIDETQGTTSAWAAPMQLPDTNGDAQRVLAGQMIHKITPSMEIGFALTEGTNGLAAQMSGKDRPTFLLAQSAGADSNLRSVGDLSLALRGKLGRWGITFFADTGEVSPPDEMDLSQERQFAPSRMRALGTSLDRTFGTFGATLGATFVQEDRTVLGSWFHRAFGGGGANTMFFDADAEWEFTPNWRLGAAWRQGWTVPEQTGLVATGSRFVTRSWSIDLQRSSLIFENDRLGLRIAQPLRVESGGFDLRLPVSYSYETSQAIYAVHTLNLAPTGREFIGEVSWQAPLEEGFAAASVYFRREPGHFAGAEPDSGIVLRWSRGF